MQFVPPLRHINGPCDSTIARRTSLPTAIFSDRSSANGTPLINADSLRRIAPILGHLASRRFGNGRSILAGISSLSVRATYPESSRVSRVNSPLTLSRRLRIVGACRPDVSLHVRARARAPVRFWIRCSRIGIEFRHENHRGPIVYPITETLLCGISRV